jgi:hypothetical protein
MGRARCVIARLLLSPRYSDQFLLFRDEWVVLDISLRETLFDPGPTSGSANKSSGWQTWKRITSLCEAQNNSQRQRHLCPPPCSLTQILRERKRFLARVATSFLSCVRADSEGVPRGQSAPIASGLRACGKPDRFFPLTQCASAWQSQTGHSANLPALWSEHTVIFLTAAYGCLDELARVEKSHRSFPLP